MALVEDKSKSTKARIDKLENKMETKMDTKLNDV